ncbi:uncharacterized protein UHOD_12299 [Ustilago sp. UG-2017b]|nr:uncharacterized protein UHOD_12299 [Ustilago sp. UG-2017b]
MCSMSPCSSQQEQALFLNDQNSPPYHHFQMRTLTSKSKHLLTSIHTMGLQSTKCFGGGTQRKLPLGNRSRTSTVPTSSRSMRCRRGDERVAKVERGGENRRSRERRSQHEPDQSMPRRSSALKRGVVSWAGMRRKQEGRWFIWKEHITVSMETMDEEACITNSHAEKDQAHMQGGLSAYARRAKRICEEGQAPPRGGPSSRSMQTSATQGFER